MHKVIVKIGEGGKTEVKVEGHAGAGCSGITKALEGALGKTVKDKKTDEFYKSEVQQNQYDHLG